LLVIIVGWGKSGKAILQVSGTVFFRALSKYFSGKVGFLAPLEKIGPYAYVIIIMCYAAAAAGKQS